MSVYKNIFRPWEQVDEVRWLHQGTDTVLGEVVWLLSEIKFLGVEGGRRT